MDERHPLDAPQGFGADSDPPYGDNRGPNEQREAREAGVCFYKLPDALDPNDVDELIRGAVFTINASEWVWTGESCQGHPDRLTPSGWDHNNRPMLRLICEEHNAGRMLRLLCRACDRPIEEWDEFGMSSPSGLELWPQTRKPGWFEVLVYIPASNTIQRNAGLKVFERFAEFAVQETF